MLPTTLLSLSPIYVKEYLGLSEAGLMFCAGGWIHLFKEGEGMADAHCCVRLVDL